MKYTYDYDELKHIQGGFAFTFFLIGVPSLQFWALYIFDPVHGELFDVIDVFQLGSFILSLIVLWFFLKTQGLYIKNNNLFSAEFILGKPIHKKKINLKGATDVAIVRYINRHQRYNELNMPIDKYFMDTKYKVFILNELHSKRKLIHESDDKFAAEKIAQFIQNGLHLKLTEFNPPKSARRRR